MGRTRFVGLANFVEIFSNDPKLLRFIGNTLLFTVVTTTGKIAIGLALALLLHEKSRGAAVLRTIFYLPVVLSPLIIGLIFRSIFDPSRGLINQALRAAGLDALARQWLADPATAMPAVMSVEIWRLTGFCMVVFLAGLQLIPRELYEAAKIDGAGAGWTFRAVTLPFLRHAFTINFVMNVIWGLKTFDIVFVLTRGGPGDLTGVMQTGIFLAFSSGLYGLATAMGVVMFVLTAGAALVTLRALSHREVDVA
jgi:raffinose/stachyose/melibiose transport system permease protein